MACEYLTHEDYMATVNSVTTGHWRSGAGRWNYHAAAVEIARRLNPDYPRQVLEMGTMGVSIVKGSDTIDYAEKWNFRKFRPTFQHDARQFPWPVANKAYDLFIALRVFHHLTPLQAECFAEARRIARNVIIVAPEVYSVDSLKDTSRGIPRDEVTAWNNGVPPTETVEFKSWIGNLYFWDETALA